MDTEHIKAMPPEIQDIYKALSLVYVSIHKSIPDQWSEKRIVQEKIAEASMWLRLSVESNQPVKAVLTNKSTGERFEKDITKRN